MVTKYRDGLWKVSLNDNDHNPPHVDIWFSNFKARVKITDEGVEFMDEEHDIPRNKIKEALAFALRHKPALLEEWNEKKPKRN